MDTDTALDVKVEEGKDKEAKEEQKGREREAGPGTPQKPFTPLPSSPSSSSTCSSRTASPFSYIHSPSTTPHHLGPLPLFTDRLAHSERQPSPSPFRMGYDGEREDGRSWLETRRKRGGIAGRISGEEEKNGAKKEKVSERGWARRGVKEGMADGVREGGEEAEGNEAIWARALQASFIGYLGRVGVTSERAQTQYTEAVTRLVAKVVKALKGKREWGGRGRKKQRIKKMEERAGVRVSPAVGLRRFLCRHMDVVEGMMGREEEEEGRMEHEVMIKLYDFIMGPEEEVEEEKEVWRKEKEEEEKRKEEADVEEEEEKEGEEEEEEEGREERESRGGPPTEEVRRGCDSFLKPSCSLAPTTWPLPPLSMTRKAMRREGGDVRGRSRRRGVKREEEGGIAREGMKDGGKDVKEGEEMQDGIALGGGWEALEEEEEGEEEEEEEEEGEEEGGKEKEEMEEEGELGLSPVVFGELVHLMATGMRKGTGGGGRGGGGGGGGGGGREWGVTKYAHSEAWKWAMAIDDGVRRMQEERGEEEEGGERGWKRTMGKRRLRSLLEGGMKKEGGKEGWREGLYARMVESQGGDGERAFEKLLVYLGQRDGQKGGRGEGRRG
jgi:hypothetical protein